MRPWLNWIEHLTTDQKVEGSNPSGRARIKIKHGFMSCFIFIVVHNNGSNPGSTMSKRKQALRSLSANECRADTKCRANPSGRAINLKPTLCRFLICTLPVLLTQSTPPVEGNYYSSPYIDTLYFLRFCLRL